MINFQLLDNTTLDANTQTAYTRLRFDIILKGEGSVRTPYLDSDRIPTIGIGFNLRDPNILELVLSSFGLNVTQDSALFTTFSRIVGTSYADDTALQTALNAEMAKQNTANPLVRSTFAYSSGTAGTDEMRLTFNTAILTYDNSDPSIAPLGGTR